MRNRFRWWSPRFAATTIAFILAVGGTAAIVVALTRPHTPAPPPAAAAAGRIAPTTPATHSTRPHTRKSQPPTTTAPTVPTLNYSPPAELTIPNIGVRSILTRLDRNPDGTVQVPTSFDVAGWYEHSVTPGQIGPTVILGHVDSTSGPGIFYRVGSLNPGDIVNLKRLDGKDVHYVITGVRQYPKTAFPTLDVYGNTTIPTIRLVTCGGTFDNATHHYLSNIIAYGEIAR